MRNVAKLTIVTTAVTLVALLAQAARLQADSNLSPPASKPDGVKSNTGRSNPDKPRFVEVRSGLQSWQGLDIGRASNLLLLMTRDGQLRRVELDEAAQIQELSKPFNPAAAGELTTALRQEFGQKFQIVRTAHYLVCHDTDESFAREAGDLAEELYRAFMSHFGSRGMALTKPQFPLIMLIFDTESEFQSYLARSPGAPAFSQIAGYFSVQTNRVAFYNAAGKDKAKSGSARWHNLTTVVHETTHQLAFNTGCHRRFADNPLWLVEGLAMYFESPGIQGNKIVWTEVGKLNRPRLDRFATYRRSSRSSDAVRSLVTNDDRFRSDSTVGDAYAESWALTYFLIKTRPSQFQRYMKTIAGKQPLEQDTPQKRLGDFQVAFGQDLRMLDSHFLRYVDEELK